MQIIYKKDYDNEFPPVSLEIAEEVMAHADAQATRYQELSESDDTPEKRRLHRERVTVWHSVREGIRAVINDGLRHVN